MAVKKSTGINPGSGKKKSMFDIIKSVDKSAEILAEDKTAEISDYIDTGNYILNAAITGSMFKGVPAGRCTVLAGDPGTGKTYLAMSICRNAQKKGYFVVYMDSEASVDTEFIKRLGCDPERMMVKPVMTISEVSTFVSNICKQISETPEEERDKLILVLDSLGNLTSDKEYNDTVEGNSKRDMTKQQEIKALFRTNATALGRLNIPFIVNSHVYQTLDLYAKKIVSGGSGINFNASVTLMLSVSKMDDRESDKIAASKGGEVMKTGVIVTAKPQKSRFTIPHVVQFQIPFYKAPNPYVGIEQYLNWDNSGIIQGSVIDQKAYDKLSDAEKSTCHPMKDENGADCYAFPRSTVRTIVVRHLGKQVPIAELFTPKVLTEELLHSLDESTIRPNFELPTTGSTADIDELLENE